MDKIKQDIKIRTVSLIKSVCEEINLQISNKNDVKIIFDIFKQEFGEPTNPEVFFKDNIERIKTVLKNEFFKIQNRTIKPYPIKIIPEDYKNAAPAFLLSNTIFKSNITNLKNSIDEYKLFFNKNNSEVKLEISSLPMDYFDEDIMFLLLNNINKNGVVDVKLYQMLKQIGMQRNTSYLSKRINDTLKKLRMLNIVIKTDNIYYDKEQKIEIEENRGFGIIDNYSTLTEKNNSGEYQIKVKFNEDFLSLFNFKYKDYNTLKSVKRVFLIEERANLKQLFSKGLFRYICYIGVNNIKSINKDRLTNLSKKINWDIPYQRTKKNGKEYKNIFKSRLERELEKSKEELLEIGIHLNWNFLKEEKDYLIEYCSFQENI